jgi:hypothetical protein
MAVVARLELLYTDHGVHAHHIVTGVCRVLRIPQKEAMGRKLELQWRRSSAIVMFGSRSRRSHSRSHISRAGSLHLPLVRLMTSLQPRVIDMNIMSTVAAHTITMSKSELESTSTRGNALQFFPIHRLAALGRSRFVIRAHRYNWGHRRRAEQPRSILNR